MSVLAAVQALLPAGADVRVGAEPLPGLPVIVWPVSWYYGGFINSGYATDTGASAGWILELELADLLSLVAPTSPGVEG